MQVTSKDFQSRFDINKVSFKNVSTEFERDFRNAYQNSLEMMSDSKDNLQNQSGANTLGILEKMSYQLDRYNRQADFGESYEKILREFQAYTET